jgi:hypothetical protein
MLFLPIHYCKILNHKNSQIVKYQFISILYIEKQKALFECNFQVDCVTKTQYIFTIGENGI